MKKVVVISTSLRAGSNSQILAEKFAEGAKAAGNEIEFITLRRRLGLRFFLSHLVLESLTGFGDGGGRDAQ